MNICSFVRAAHCGLMLVLAGCIAAHAAEIRMLVSPGFGPVMQDLGPKFERASGHQLAVSSASLGAIVKRVREGEIIDVVLAPRPAIDSFLKEGKATADNVTAIATAGMGVAVRAGAPKPDISSPEALKRTLLAARSITYPDTRNPAGNPELGIHIARVLDGLGITDEMKSKTVFPGPVDVGMLVASGKAELGIAQLQQLARGVGIDIVGPLPRDLQDPVVFQAAILAAARSTGAAKALIDFMRTPEAASAMKAQRMDPASPGPGGSH